MTDIIKVSNLTKVFGDVKAVQDISFSVPSGKIYGFLGQNGAGKSTTIRMLLTLVHPDEGGIEIFGMDIKRFRKQILRQTGAVIERPDLYKYLTASENLRIFSALSGIKSSSKNIMEQLRRVGLADRAHSKVKTYSQGMKQRLGIAVALAHDPQLIILDEPTNGLDPQGIADVRSLVFHLCRDLGKTLLISSHLLSEMELIADSLLIINKGRKIAEGTKEELLNPVKIQVELITDNKESSISKLSGTKWAESLLGDIKGDGTILFELEKSLIPDLNRSLVEKGVNVISLRPKHSLEDLFLSLTAQD